jgi:hypothetical protein
VQFFQYVVFNNPTWDFRTLDWDAGVAAADKAAAGVLNVTDPNLKPFFDRGGRLLLYHGGGSGLAPAGAFLQHATRTIPSPSSSSRRVRLREVRTVTSCLAAKVRHVLARPVKGTLFFAGEASRTEGSTGTAECPRQRRTRGGAGTACRAAWLTNHHPTAAVI